MQLELDFAPATATPERVFLADRAPLTAAAEWLLRRAPAHERVVDLQAELVIVPTARAGRRLLETLVDRAEALDRGLLPPRIVTPGAVPGSASVPNELRRVAWLEAIGALPNDCVAAFGTDASAQRQALALALLAARIDRELDAAGHTFASAAERVTHPERYLALERLRQECARRVRSWGFADSQAELTLDEGAHVVLLGVVELSAALRRMLAPYARRTSVLTLAPEQWRERFDAWGALVSAPWIKAELDVGDSALCFASGARDQAEAVVRWLAELEPMSTRDVSFAVLDEEVTSPLEHALLRAGVSAHVGMPMPFSATAVARLVQAAADLLERRSVEAWATFVRHPDLGLARWLASFDRFREEHLPNAPDFVGIGNDIHAERTRELAERARDVLGELSSGERSLAEWGGALLGFLSRVYGEQRLGRSTAPEKRLLDSLDAVVATVERLQLCPNGAPMTAAAALRTYVALLDDAAIARESTEDAADIFGWLELPLDEAPITVAVGCNEGFLPQALNADALLPNALRKELGLTDNDARYARDAYVLSTVLRTRRRVLFVSGRRSLVGEPLLPSRLLLAADGRVVARRVQRFFAEGSEAPAAASSGQPLPVPEPDPRDRAPDEIPVTAFADYLACPYRFYLKRVLRLRAVDDRAQEMTPLVSGTLLHLVLCDFGIGETRNETNAKHIRSALEHALHTRAKERFGPSPAMAVRAQLDQLAERFDAFAAWQAGWASSGWRIAHCELEFKGKMAPFLVDETPVYLKGKLDRVDMHPELGVVVFDYKTGERAIEPERRHQKRGVWVDLQLPLYRYLWRSADPHRPLGLGYVTLGKNPRETGARIARWSDVELEGAYDTARSVVRALRQRVFWPPAASPPRGFEEYAVICQDDQLGGGEEVEP